jgi:hypothetical protein
VTGIDFQEKRSLEEVHYGSRPLKWNSWSKALCWICSVSYNKQCVIFKNIKQQRKNRVTALFLSDHCKFKQVTAPVTAGDLGRAVCNLCYLQPALPSYSISNKSRYCYEDILQIYLKSIINWLYHADCARPSGWAWFNQLKSCKNRIEAFRTKMKSFCEQHL